jgi:hypothetical protein
MTTLTHLDATPLQTTNDVRKADANRTGLDSTSMNREAEQGHAVAGSIVMLAAHWLVG